MKRILINKSERGYSTALLEDGKLVELLEDSVEESLAGNIYLGVVKKVTGGFIFLDIGQERQAFLDTKDGRERRLFPPGRPSAKPGDTFVVQVLKDAVGNKGPNVTSSISYTGRYIMLYESLDTDRVNSSKKIEDFNETRRLKNMIKGLLSDGFSAIIRSAAEGKDEDTIKAEIDVLMSRWGENLDWKHKTAPATLWSQSSIVKTLMEVVREDIDEIIIDNPDTFSRIQKEFLPTFPDFESKISLHRKDEDIFAAYFVKTQMDKLYDKRVWLKCGGFIVVEQTEACVVIDVNTGKFQSKGGEAAKLQLNLEAAKEIAYQLRLRNLSGIVIVDFLRMMSKADMHSLLKDFELELHKDRIPALLVGMTTLGLVEVTRKRVRKPIEKRNGNALRPPAIT
ncbi:MAG: ribonuclease E/G [Defluviitaleaceae bacterium]|nr:ribonuclease E/G [Defluviitaleaceae bacterium]